MQPIKQAPSSSAWITLQLSMAQQISDKLQPLMAKLEDALHSDQALLHMKELKEISNILTANKDKITSQSPELEKKDKLLELLRKIDEALEQCVARSKQKQPQPAAKSKKKTLPSVSDCNPFKSRSSLSSSASPSAIDDTVEAIDDTVKALLQQTIDILGEPAVTELYEWTTSYVDENRIYGWDKDADKVVDALVGVEEAGKDKVLFRAAGITGIHGSGKTALAQKVFVHDRIKDAFPLRLWVCVGPPDNEDKLEDKLGLLYRILDNLGLDTYKVEDIVEKSDAVQDAVKNSKDKKSSSIGVLLFILYVTLYKTGYLIVFDDIRAYDDWYRNLTLMPPTDGGEWNDRLAYGLPKARKSAVLVTCRKEDDARDMVRTGNVFRPPELGVPEGWKLFEREYGEAKKKAKEKDEKKPEEKKEEEKVDEQKKEAIDEVYKELEEMKDEIIGKCLGLPVAIIEAAKGFAVLKDDDPPAPEAEGKAAAADQPETTTETEPAQSTSAS